MGPFEDLLKHGATIFGIARKNPKKWKRIFELAKTTPGTLMFPLPKKAEEYQSEDDMIQDAGCDLIQDTPEILSWLEKTLPENDEQIVLGNYTYGHGQLFTRLSIATDYITKEITKNRENVIVAYLGSPSLVYPIPDECAEKIKQNTNSAPFGHKFLKFCCGGSKSVFENSYRELGEYVLCNGIVTKQGFNYLLAKQIQNWRTIVLRSEKKFVSFNMAPITRTKSVLMSRMIKAGVEGMTQIHPLEVYNMNTVSRAMFYLLMANVLNEKSPVFQFPGQKNEKNESVLVEDGKEGEEEMDKEDKNASKEVKGERIWEFFGKNSVHSGIWSCPYTMNSVSLVAVLAHTLKFW